MNCPNCGRPLAEGEICNCINSNEGYVNPNPIINEPQTATPPPFESQVAQAPYTQPNPYAQANTYYQPPQGAFYQPGSEKAPASSIFAVPSPADGPAKTNYPEGYRIKRKYAAVLLAWTLGAFGIHNFYLGYHNKAVAQVLIATLGSLLFGLGLVAASVWAIIDAVQLLTDKIDRDADGYKIQTFEEALAKELNKNEQ